jgi:hypothetical protein
MNTGPDIRRLFGINWTNLAIWAVVVWSVYGLVTTIIFAANHTVQHVEPNLATVATPLLSTAVTVAAYVATVRQAPSGKRWTFALVLSVLLIGAGVIAATHQVSGLHTYTNNDVKTALLGTLLVVVPLLWFRIKPTVRKPEAVQAQA